LPRNADSPTRNEEGEVVFVKPWEEMQPFDEFIDFVAHQELAGGLEEVRYAQTRECLLTPPFPFLSLPLNNM